MKGLLIAGLLGLNAVLLVVLLLGATTQPADAQVVVGAATDYLIYTAELGSDNDAVYIVDMKQQRMVALKWDQTRKKMVQFRGGRNLKMDFPAR